MDRKLTFLAFFLPMVLFSQTILLDGPAKAFPTAHGFGRFATGGRGGSVIAVTSLNNSGAGTLREALLTTGARIIVFRVSGTITISSTIALSGSYGNFTIEGGTAPGQGVQIVFSNNSYIQSDCSNFIVRNMRFRGVSGSTTSQTMWRNISQSGSNRSNIVFDHCSFSWANTTEMPLDFEATGTPPTDQIHSVTVSNCIFGENYRGILQYKGHWDFSYYRNYFYGTYMRSPTSNYPEFQDNNTLTSESINQIWHNEFHLTREASFGSRVTMIGNKRSNSSNSSYNASGDELVALTSSGADNSNAANSYLYVNDNLNEVGTIYPSSNASYIETAPYYSSDIAGNLILPASNINAMLPNIGAFRWARDSHDTRFINYYLNDNGTLGTYTGTPDTLTGGTVYTDTDGDGLSDSYETLNGGSVSPNTRPGTANISGGRTVDQTEVTNYSSAGYTHMDIFLADIARDWDDFATSPSAGDSGKKGANASVVNIIVN